MSHRHRFSFWFFLLAAGVAAPVLAEELPAAAAPTPEPQIVTTAYGDWALRCRKESGEKAKENEASKADRACEISQTLEAPDHSGPIAKLSVGRPGGAGALHAIVILPNNVSFPSSVHIRSDEKDVSGVQLNWVRCIPGGCFAEAVLADATVNFWHGLNSTGRITFMDSSGAEISLPMSFHGFGEALDALNKAL
ncbi:MAG: invasion associated locus B family protein [Methylovirgula sp.]